MSLHRPGFDILFRERGFFDWPGFGRWGGQDASNHMVNLDMVHVFETPGSSVLSIPKKVNARYLVVSGGGAQPGTVVERTSVLYPGEYVIEVGTQGQRSRVSGVIAEPRDDTSIPSVPGNIGHESDIEGTWNLYATGSSQTVYGGKTHGGSRLPGVVIVRYSIKDLLNEYLDQMVRMDTIDESTRRRVHAIQSVMSPPANTQIDEIDTLVDMLTNAYMQKVSSIQHGDGTPVSRPQLHIEARRYRMIRRTVLDVLDGSGCMYTPQNLIALLREQLIGHGSTQSVSSPNMKRHVPGRSGEDMDLALTLVDHVSRYIESCPKLPEGRLVADGKDGRLYIFQADALRHIPFDTFRQMDDTRYTLFPAGFLDACQKRPSTSLIQQRTLTTVEAPDTITPIFEPALFTVSHTSSGLAFTVRGRQIVLEPHNVSSPNQQWRLSGGGFIRSASESEIYMTPSPNCDGIVSTRDPVAPWVIERRGNAVIEIKNACGSYVSVDPIDREIDMVPSSSNMTMWTTTYTKASPAATLKKNIKIF